MSVTNALRTAWRNLTRDFRGGELRLLLWALIIAIAAQTSVGFFTHRMKLAVAAQATELLAADLLISANAPVLALLEQRAQQMQLSTANTLTFPSIVVAGKHSHLADIKAVSKLYPLRGTLALSETPYGLSRKVQGGPQPGEVWIDARLMNALHAALGEPLTVGEHTLRITGILAYEPDRGSQIFAMAPRALMRLEDIPKTKLVQPGSRIRYHLLLAGEPSQILAARKALEPSLPRYTKMVDVRDARPEMRSAMDRGASFLLLASLVSVLLACVAIAIAARRYAERHLDQCALWRCLGADQRFINQVFLFEILFIGVIGGFVGTVSGYAVHFVLASSLQALIGPTLPPPGAAPWFTGIGLGLALLVVFAWPPLARLKHTPPLRILRRTPFSTRRVDLTLVVGGLAFMAVLVALYASELALAGKVLAAVIALIVSLWVASHGIIALLHRVSKPLPLPWRLSLRNLSRRARTTHLQTIGFGVSLMVLLLLLLVRNDLVNAWIKQLPPDAPNQFMINIQTAQMQSINVYFRKAGYPSLHFSPMVRGRLVTINNKPATSENYPDSHDARQMLEREFNLSWTSHLTSDNRVVLGRFWDSATKDAHQLSIESSVVRNLGLALNDSLVFLIAGQEVSVKITSVREVSWESLRPNFFVLAPAGLLEQYPTTWVGSFYLKSAERDFITQLVKKFPNLTVFDVDALIEQVRSVMNRVVSAIETIFLFTLLTGFVVMVAALQATHDERARESALLRVLGGSRRLLLQINAAEFLVLGTVAGFLAMLCANGTAHWIASSILRVPYTWHWLWIFGGSIACGIFIGIAGLWGTYQHSLTPPVQTLRSV